MDMVEKVRLLLVAHPTSTTAAIVVISMCFISLQLSILYPSRRRVCGGVPLFLYRLLSIPYRSVSIDLKEWPNLSVYGHGQPAAQIPYP